MTTTLKPEPAVTHTSYLLEYPIVPPDPFNGPFTATQSFLALPKALAAYEALMRSEEPHLKFKYQITLHEITSTKLREGAVVFERKPPKRSPAAKAKEKA